MKRTLRVIYQLLATTIILCQGCADNLGRNLYCADVPFKDTVYVEAQTIANADSLYVTAIRQIEVIDSLFIVLDPYNNESFLRILNRNGEHITSFGVKGIGPGEVLTAEYFTVDREEKSIQVYNLNKNEIVEYSLANLLNKKEPISKLIKINNRPSRAIALKQNRLLFPFSDDDRIVICNKDGETVFRMEYPESIKAGKEELMPRAMCYSPAISISPDGKKMTMGSYIGAILETFDIDEDRIINRGAKYIHYPVYEKLESNNVTISDNTTIGFESIASTNEFIYTLLNAETMVTDTLPTAIGVYDWDTNPTKWIATDRMLMCLCVDPDTKDIYAATYESDGRQEIVRFPAIKD